MKGTKIKGVMKDTKIEINAVAHPTDRLIVCDECGESSASFTTTKEAADWVVQHVRKHQEEDK